MPDPASSSRNENRLAREKSPYLLQHARNPVDWHPWGEEAFERARREDLPVFLSIGYSSCHWCHVMERESFENEPIARFVNERFVPVKVDREERPDVDEIYMAAVQLTTGSGGWPMSVFLTPDGKPFFAGTYFPPETRHGRIGFLSLLERLSDAWRERRPDVLASAERISEAVREHLSGDFRPARVPLSRALVERAAASAAERFDEAHGGFGSAPKFPPHGTLSLLLHEAKARGDAEALRVATRTLDAIRRGGIHDHVGGGFHRYSTDARWLVPHFEKMLYDNAQLARAFVDAFAATGEPAFRSAAEGIFSWVRREMTGEHGAFLSALDADSEGEEGRYYVFTRDEIASLLGPEAGGRFARAYAAEEGGNWRDEATGRAAGTNILHLARPIEETARSLGADEKTLEEELSRGRERLLEARRKRVPPLLDDKVVVAWNGLMIGALAHAARVLEDPILAAEAERAARFVLSRVRREDGRLLHTYRDGEAKILAYLDDHAFLANGLVDLADATGDAGFLAEARRLADTLLERFHDGERGGFFFAPDDHEDLLARSKDPFDEAVPSGNGGAALLLVRLFEKTGEPRYCDAAARSFDWQLPLLASAPRAVETSLLALALWFDGKGAAARPSFRPGSARPPSDRGQFAAGAAADSASGSVRVEASADKTTVGRGGEVNVELRLLIRDGHHVQSEKPADESLVATRLTLGEGGAFRLVGVEYPADSPVYEGEALIRARVVPLDEAPPGPARLALRLRIQSCDDRSCEAPEELSLALPLVLEAEGG